MKPVVRWLGPAGWTVLVACAPTTVDEKVFPALPQTCYEVPPPDTNQRFWSDQTVRPFHCVSEDAGAASPPAQMAVSGELTSPVSTPPASGLELTDASAAAGDAGMGAAAPATAPECTEERVRALFASELNVGGCQDAEFGGCHGNDSAANGPHLLAANLRAELLAHVSDTKDCSGETWITPGGGLEGSLLWNKVTSDDESNKPRCGDAMPLQTMGATGIPVPAAELECLRQWILKVAMGQ